MFSQANYKLVSHNQSGTIGHNWEFTLAPLWNTQPPFPFIFNPGTKFVSPQFHYIHDNNFSMVDNLGKFAKLWPEFDEEDLYNAIINYQNRERRFGKTSEQVKS